ncbi:SDR family oxidoreductase [Rhizobium sp. NLR9b]|uniref:UDP-glucuronic acid decarboxylase family protein n=1 Tax=unclassified Rhizobium TaxID=2613769 RepID=UPI001C836C27|nr:MULTISPECIES: UDP-glucuronic acid decarboxylase family protein [unclassified Rhizobium]MBX5224070.1 SDR family oxidoreductase [Rhizobium sp. NLR8a]MBX5229339.1 SDR family oxidoreductase [Rhizobium sp. NLR9b]MBX5290286.1 SDR family oxidoreductase [Rhizobium sp. NLR10b]MBX5302603.1 SDR family oxidoreductase [Rhizobium sp. NLR12b]
MLQANRRGKGKTVLVAGGAGFVGSHLCDALLGRGDSVICVDSYITGSRDNVRPLMNHPGFRLIEQDICKFIEIGEPLDQIYNLACAASPPQYQADPVHTMMTCVAGTGNLLALAERHRAAFLQASTSEVYGDPAEHPQTEDYRGNVSCTGPRACYDEGKRAAEALCFDMLRAGRVDVRVARIFNTYGPRMQANDGRIVSNLIVQALSGKPLTIYGSGMQTRSFCYVSDLVGGLKALMDVRPNPGVPVNLGNPGEFTINELAQMIRSMVPVRTAVAYRPLPKDDPQRRRPDISRATELLDWQPTVPLAEGLRYTIDWFAANLDDRPRKRVAAPRRHRAAAASQAAPLDN